MSVLRDEAGGILLTLLEVLGGSVDELEGNELEATLLEAADDVADKTALDAVGLVGAEVEHDAQNDEQKTAHLDHDVGALRDRHVDDR